MKNTLICTVGTSLFGNLRRLIKESNDIPKDLSDVKLHFTQSNWKNVANELLKLEPENRICGAEINTIQESKKKKWLDLKNLIFLVSDTQDGRNTGSVLKYYFENRKDLNLTNVEFEVIEDLNDENPQKFKINGLRNLVRVIGQYVQQFNYNEQVLAIDATGGYKAQIAIAVLMGQALNIPVYYKHERFSEIIDFPPLPISLDYDLIGYNSDILTDFERGKSFSESEIGNLDQKLRVFLTEVFIENESVFELNAIGQLFLTSFRLRYPKVAKIKRLEEGDRKEPTFRDDHYPIGFKDFVKKVWSENNWIKTCWSESYHGQKSIKGIGFKVIDEGSESKIIGTYQDKDNFGARFRIKLDDESKESLNWAVDQLNQHYRE